MTAQPQLSGTSSRPGKCKRRRFKSGWVEVMTSTHSGYVEVTMGKHLLDSGQPLDWSRDLHLLHYPVRSFEQFANEAAVGGGAVARNPAIAPREAYHWQRWYAPYRAGSLEEDYRTYLISDPEPYLHRGQMVDLRIFVPEQLAAVIHDAIRRRTRRPPLHTQLWPPVRRLIRLRVSRFTIRLGTGSLVTTETEVYSRRKGQYPA